MTGTTNDGTGDRRRDDGAGDGRPDDGPRDSSRGGERARPAPVQPESMRAESVQPEPGWPESAPERAGRSAAGADFGVLLSLAGVVFVDGLHQRLAEAGFTDYTVRSGWVLRTLGEQTLSLRELADAIGLSSPGALKAIEPMLRAGYLERTDAADRRVRAVRVTERGRAALACATAFHVAFEEGLAAEIGESDAASTRRGLEALVERGSPHLPSGLTGAP